MPAQQKQTLPEQTAPETVPAGRPKRGELSEAARKWQEENAEAIASWNDWVEKNGLPLEKYRPW